jgi:hypothetical protein
MALLFFVIVDDATYAASGGCLLHPAKLSADTVNSFKNRPLDLLGRYPAAGPLLSAQVRRLAGSDVSTVVSIILLARSADTAQVVAIGTGLARAARTCSRTRPDIEQDIKRAIADAHIAQLTVAFEAEFSSLQVVKPMGSDPKPLAAAAQIDNLPMSIARSTTGSGYGPVSSDGLSTAGSGLTFGSGGVLNTFGRSVSPTR